MFLFQGAGAVISVWDNWKRRPQPTSPSLNLPSCTSTSPHHRLPPEPPPLFSVLYNLSRRPLTECTAPADLLVPSVFFLYHTLWCPPLSTTSHVLLRVSRRIHQLAISLQVRLTLHPVKGTSEAYYSTATLLRGPGRALMIICCSSVKYWMRINKMDGGQGTQDPR